MYESDSTDSQSCQIAPDPFASSNEIEIELHEVVDIDFPAPPPPDWLDEPAPGFEEQVTAPPKVGKAKGKDKTAKTKTTKNLESSESSYDYIPSGTLLHNIVSRFKAHTDIPLALPFFLSLQLFSSFLLKENVTINICGHQVEPSLWIVALCESGAGKSYALNELTTRLQKVLDTRGKNETTKDLIWNASGIASTLEFMSQWSGEPGTDTTDAVPTHNRRLMIIDEASDFFQRLRNEKSNLHDMYSRLLDAHSHSAIEYSSRAAGKITVEKPVVSFLGLATPERYIDKITPDDIEGGFYYRFLHFISRENRPMTGHAIYPANMLDGVEDGWSDLISSIKHNEYTITMSALKWYNKWFNSIVLKHKIMPRAYLRRSSFALHKLALLYHFFLGKGHTKEIDVDAYQYANRIMHHFNDAASKIIKQKTDTQSLQDLRTVEKYIENRTKKGKTTTVRDIVIGTKLSTQTARMIYRLIFDYRVQKEISNEKR